MKKLAKVVGLVLLAWVILGVVDGSTALTFADLIAAVFGLALSVL